MTIASETARNTYTLNGATTVYPYTFRILDAADIQVLTRTTAGVETTLPLNSGYTVSGVGNTSGGAVTLASAGTNGDALIIRRDRTIRQDVSLANQGLYSPRDVEQGLDAATVILQQLQDELSRAVRVSPALSGYDMELSSAPAGKVLVGTGAGVDWASLDASATALPGGGRTVATLSAYLANNAVFNVKDYGAVGNGITNDTAAFLACAAACVRAAQVQPRSSSATGAVFAIPPGDYVLVSKITLPIGVKVIGSGARTSRLLATGGAAVDVLDFLVPGAGYADGTLLSGFEIVTPGGTAGARDGISMSAPGYVTIADVRVHGVGRYGINLQNAIFVVLQNTFAESCVSAGLLVGGAAPSTTVVVLGGGFRYTSNGFGADISCIGATFLGTTFEGNGSLALPQYGGCLVRTGDVTFEHLYAEDNAGAVVEVGVAGSGLSDPIVSVRDMSPRTGPTYSVANSYGVRVRAAKKVSIVDGDYSAYAKPIVADSPALAAVTSITNALTYPNNPTVTGGSITDFASVIGKDAPSGRYEHRVAVINAGRGYRQTVEGWGVNPVVINQVAPAALLRSTGSPFTTKYFAVRPGSITGFGIVASAWSAGAMTATVYLNGVATALTLTVSSAGTINRQLTSALDAINFAAGDYIEVKYTSTAAWGAGIAFAASVEVAT